MMKEVLISKLWQIREKIEQDSSIDISKDDEFIIKIGDILQALRWKYETKTKEILRKIPSMTW